MAGRKSPPPDWDTVGYVVASRYRLAVLSHLADGPGTPTAIADGTDYSLSHISRAIADLRDSECVELLVAESTKIGRLYGLTEAGERAWQTIDDNQLH